MNVSIRRRLRWLVQWCLILAFSLGLLWVCSQYFEAENYRMAVFSGFFAIIFTISLYRMTAKTLSQLDRAKEHNRGRPARLEDAFCVGDAVAVLAVTKETKEGKFATLQNYYGIKLVKLPEDSEVTVGKHYYVNEEGRLTDFLRTEKRIESDPVPVTA